MLLSLGSCETVDFGDTNENPNGPLELNSAALLTAAQRRFATIGFRDWLANPTLYVQYQAQPVYQDPSRYAETPTNWQAYYVQTLSNLQQIINISNDPEAIQDPAYLGGGSPNNQIAVAKIMKVIIFKRLTDTYGDIPYMEALDSDNPTPAYTPQSEIYADFVVQLREAREMLDASEDGPSGDIIYDGEVGSWQRLANSLLLDVAITMSEVAPDEAAAIFNEALSNEHGVIETVEQAAWYQPMNVSTLVNPWTAFRAADYTLAEYFMDALQGDPELDVYSNDTYDSRLLVYATLPEAEGLAYGLENYPADLDVTTIAQISSYITSPLSPLPWFTSSYTYLHRAEAAARGWTTEDAEEMLRKGIVQSYTAVTEKYGQGPHTGSDLEPISIIEEADAFASSRIADIPEAGIIQVILEEKWAALFPQGFKAWNEWRRTGFPILTPSPNPLNDGAIPTRYLYPGDEDDLNAANYEAALMNLSPSEDKNTSSVWWDVD